MKSDAELGKRGHVSVSALYRGRLISGKDKQSKALKDPNRRSILFGRTKSFPIPPIFTTIFANQKNNS